MKAGLPPLSPLGAARLAIGEADDGLGVARIGAALAELELPEELAALGLEIARLPPGLDVDQRGALALLALTVLASARQGSTRLPLDGSGPLVDLLAERLAPRARAAFAGLWDRMRAGTQEALGPYAPVIGLAGEHKPLILDGGALYAQRLARFEERVASSLATRLGRAPREPNVEEALDAVLARPPVVGGVEVRLSDEQQEAVRASLRAPLTVISGGPGTGKTSIVVSILRALVRLGVPPAGIALAAPTGKAANRMEEAVRAALAALPDPDAADAALARAAPSARTLHRLLGYSPHAGRFKHHAGSPLAERVVIVDECSMIDLFLMDQLVAALRDDARLVLLGDADQLPSVEAGAVLRELLAAGGDAARTLRRSYRMDPSDPQGRHILSVARRVNAGDPDLYAGEEPIVRRASVGELRFEGVEQVEAEPARRVREELLEAWYARRIRALPDADALARRVYRFEAGVPVGSDAALLERLMRHHQRFRILCVTRGEARPTGAEAVNRALHARIIAEARAAGDAEGLHAAPTYYPGEPVLVEANDYERGLWNGDQGLVLRASLDGAPPRHLAVFPRGEGWSLVPLEALRGRLAHAFAMTVHKSQGSEFDHVALLLPDEDLPLLAREIVYTALTRSRRSVVIVGRAELLARGVARRILRSSGLGERIARGRRPSER